MKRLALTVVLLLMAGAAQAQFSTPNPPVLPGPGVNRSTAVDLDYIPPMPVAEAYQVLVRSVGGQDPLGWRFEGDLGQATMRGAKFFGVAFENAAEMVLAAADLTPPSDGDKTVRVKRTIPLSEGFEYIYPTKSSGIGAISGYYPVIGSYKDRSGNWRYLINTRAVMDNKLISWLLDMAGCGYSISVPPANPDGTIGDQAITVRMVDVTLSEALDSITASLDMKYRKNGTTYVFVRTYRPLR